jgi:hypothetical protein
MLRGAVAAWLGLITLQAVGTKSGSGRVAELATDTTRLLARILDPDVPAIPDRRPGAAAATAAAVLPDLAAGATSVGTGVAAGIAAGQAQRAAAGK